MKPMTAGNRNAPLLRARFSRPLGVIPHPMKSIAFHNSRAPRRGGRPPLFECSVVEAGNPWIQPRRAGAQA